jgi:hypothetical protein
MKKILLFSLLFVSAISFSQVGIGTTAPNSSAALDVTSTTKGLLPPRMTQVQMNAIPTPANGLIVYCTDCTPTGIYSYNSPTWSALGGAAAATVSSTCTGFIGSYCTAALSGTTYVVTVTNNDFSAKQVTPTTTDLTLSGLTGVTVASVSPNTVQTINAGASLVITYTISGTPAATGTLTGTWAKQGLTCSSTVAVATAKAVTAASSLPALCISTPLTAITHTTSGATTGIGTPTGLPAGVTAAWASNTITISGTPTASGTFNYSIPVNGCGGTVNATGTITVNPALVAGAASATPTVLINVVMTNVTHSTTAATGIGTATGLPPGVTAAWAANTITISGTPTVLGTFAYTIPLVGAGVCSANATGTITVVFPTPTFNCAGTIVTPNSYNLVNNASYTGTVSVPYTVTQSGGTYPAETITNQGITFTRAAGNYALNGTISYTISGTYTGITNAVFFVTFDAFAGGCSVAVWDAIRGAIAQGGDASGPAYDAANVNDWVKITLAEYNAMSAIMNTTVKSGCNDARMNTPVVGGNYVLSGDTWGGKNWSYILPVNGTSITTIPASHYVYGFSVVAASNASLNGLRPAVSTGQTGTITFLNPLNNAANTGAIRIEYFVMKRPSFQTVPTAPSFVAGRNSETIFGPAALTDLIMLFSQNGFTTGLNTVGGVFYTVSFQMLSSPTKQW